VLDVFGRLRGGSIIFHPGCGKIVGSFIFNEKLTCHPRPFDRLPPQQFRLSKVQARVHSRKIGEQ
jgi:hypothetical protein